MLTPRELLTTTRSVRLRLDLERAVDRETVEECLRVGLQAPNGSNLQLWNWVLVDDPAVRARMAEIYRASIEDQQRMSAEAAAAGQPSRYPKTPQQERISRSVMHLRDHLHEVPVLVVPTIAGRMDGVSVFEQASLWGSVLPAVWNFMLALRAEGMGSAWTTIHLHREREMADLLGIPYERVTQAGLFPVAWTLGTDFRAADRSGAERAIRWNHW
ncbi:nitroreductase family protein [Streptodolium elevatio]|uniref:Nitroreductase family protein n=1 Tax=Streptodolium elevatio TaxID=3157996 RepID=A0ABV3D9T3_9ACTN